MYDLRDAARACPHWSGGGDKAGGASCPNLKAIQDRALRFR
jgi:hypothetical protein